MKLLVIGNSQAGAIKRAYDSRQPEFNTGGIEWFFYVVPGGFGPDFTIADGKLILGARSEKSPPFIKPKGTEKIPLDEFDAVFVSALGNTVGSYTYNNYFVQAGVLAECEPRGRALSLPPVSDHCYSSMIQALLERQSGIKTLRRISAAFDGPIYVQRFPLLSDAVRENPAWRLRQWYTKPIKAYNFLATECAMALATIAKETGAILLDYPDIDHPNGMSPQELMRDDCIHQSDVYAGMILDQLVVKMLDR
ncbi:SGNH/GDSL hydrolase family protein [Neptunicoccus sediminis]|uniref:SGNH/GDSL hydrolase family protein n=1 Tax=Neptunicoccus sediminis TaxID=1892596 RepID=UPI000845E73E|nr:SGNH/GDSL hydrolase family protein [Neptunicoccus sediminis]